MNSRYMSRKPTFYDKTVTANVHIKQDLWFRGGPSERPAH